MISEQQVIKTVEQTPWPTLEELEKIAIRVRLELLNGNRTRAAKSLNIGVRTLQRKLKRYGWENEWK